MHQLLWVLQAILGIYFVGIGVVHFTVPPGLPAPLQWMYDLPMSMHYFIGAAEILGGLGLILPGLARTETWLTPLAAAGLMVVMLLAAMWHITRNEPPFIPLVLAPVLAFVAYGRWKLHPLPGTRRLLGSAA